MFFEQFFRWNALFSAVAGILIYWKYPDPIARMGAEEITLFLVVMILILPTIPFLPIRKASREEAIFSIIVANALATLLVSAVLSPAKDAFPAGLAQIATMLFFIIMLCYYIGNELVEIEREESHFDQRTPKWQFIVSAVPILALVTGSCVVTYRHLRKD